MANNQLVQKTLLEEIAEAATRTFGNNLIVPLSRIHVSNISQEEFYSMPSQYNQTNRGLPRMPIQKVSHRNITEGTAGFINAVRAETTLRKERDGLVGYDVRLIFPSLKGRDTVVSHAILLTEEIGRVVKYDAKPRGFFENRRLKEFAEKQGKYNSLVNEVLSYLMPEERNEFVQGAHLVNKKDLNSYLLKWSPYDGSPLFAPIWAELKGFGKGKDYYSFSPAEKETFSKLTEIESFDRKRCHDSQEAIANFSSADGEVQRAADKLKENEKPWNALYNAESDGAAKYFRHQVLNNFRQDPIQRVLGNVVYWDNKAVPFDAPRLEQKLQEDLALETIYQTTLPKLLKLPIEEAKKVAGFVA